MIKLLLPAIFLSFLTFSNASALYLDDLIYEVDNSKKISMDFKNALLNDVLKIFSQQSGLNFIATNDISEKTVNLYLDQVPVEEALERILSANDLTYEIKAGSNVFVVKALDKPAKHLMTRVYHLKHATVPSSKLNSTLSGFDSGGGSDSGGGGEEGGESGGGESGGAEGESGGSSGGSSGGGLVDAVSAILTGDGKIVEDPRTNSLIITDIPSMFPMIEQTIARLDTRNPQILIEAEMLDISKNATDELGAKFGKEAVNFHGASKQSVFPFDSGSVLRSHDFATPKYTASKISFENLNFVVEFLRKQTDTRNLARPRILTLNNETAEINIKTDETIGVTTTADSSGDGTSSLETVEAERAETGVTLKVTPQANIETREIIMAIEPKVIQARAVSSEFEVFGAFKDPEERGAKAILRVRDGDTIVIGGLLRTDINQTKTKVPLVSRVPILGMAFRHKNKTEIQRELIIFITPHILDEAVALHSQSSDSFQKIVREQDIPNKKLDQINKDLSYIEKNRY